MHLFIAVMLYIQYINLTYTYTHTLRYWMNRAIYVK
jgi:hypothetical protein